MNKKIFFLVVVLLLIGFFVGYKALNKKDKKSPIDEIVSSYKNYEFFNVKTYKDDIFKIDEPIVDYSNTKKSLVVKVGSETLSIYLIDDILHIMKSDNTDYKYDSIGGVERMMSYSYCACQDCIRLVIINDEGYLYYLDIKEDTNYNSKNLFTKIDSEDYFINIGYIENLNINDVCGVNGLAAITDDNKLIIYDNNMNEFNQDYYDFISNSDSTLYIYPDGSLKLGQSDTSLDIKASNIFISSDKYYAISNDGYLYEIDLNGNIKKVNSNRVVKIGIYKKNDTIERLIIVYSDASAKNYNIDKILVDMSKNN